MSLPHQTASETCLPVISSDHSLYEYNCTINQSAFSLINQHVLVRTKRSASSQYFYRELPIVVITRSQSNQTTDHLYFFLSNLWIYKKSVTIHSQSQSLPLPPPPQLPGGLMRKFLNDFKFYFDWSKLHHGTAHVTQVFINIYRKSTENFKPKSQNCTNWELGHISNIFSFSSTNGDFNGEEKFDSGEDISVCRCKRFHLQILKLMAILN